MIEKFQVTENGKEYRVCVEQCSDNTWFSWVDDEDVGDICSYGPDRKGCLEAVAWMLRDESKYRSNTQTFDIIAVDSTLLSSSK